MSTPSNKFILQISGSRATLESGTATDRLKNSQFAIENSSGTTHLAYRELTSSPPGSSDGTYHTVANLTDVIGDNLGDHVATQNINMGTTNWLSYNGSSNGGFIFQSSYVSIQNSGTSAELKFLNDGNSFINKSSSSNTMRVTDYNELILTGGCPYISLSAGSGIVGISTGQINFEATNDFHITSTNGGVDISTAIDSKQIYLSTDGENSHFKALLSGDNSEVELKTTGDMGHITLETTASSSHITLKSGCGDIILRSGTSNTISISGGNVGFLRLSYAEAGGGTPNAYAYLDSAGTLRRGATYP